MLGSPAVKSVEFCDGDVDAVALYEEKQAVAVVFDSVGEYLTAVGLEVVE